MDDKIWGKTDRAYEDRNVTVDVLIVKKGGRCSWHYHENKYNHFYVICGRLGIKVDGTGKYPNQEWVVVKPGYAYSIKPGEGNAHYFEALEDSIVVEVCTIGDLDDDDICRLELGQLKHEDGTVEHVREDEDDN